MPAIIFSRIAGSAHRSLVADAFFWRTTGSAFDARISAIIFSRSAGSAHRAFVALLIFARLAGLRSAALNFTPSMGSAHRAFDMALCLSRISGETGDRGRVRLIPSGLRKKWAAAGGALAQGCCGEVLGCTDRTVSQMRRLTIWLTFFLRRRMHLLLAVALSAPSRASGLASPGPI